MELIILRSVPRRVSQSGNQGKEVARASQNGNPRLMSIEEVRRRWQAKRLARHGSFCESPQPA